MREIGGWADARPAESPPAFDSEVIIEKRSIYLAISHPFWKNSDKQTDNEKLFGWGTALWPVNGSERGITRADVFSALQSAYAVMAADVESKGDTYRAYWDLDERYPKLRVSKLEYYSDFGVARFVFTYETTITG